MIVTEAEPGGYSYRGVDLRSHKLRPRGQRVSTDALQNRNAWPRTAGNLRDESESNQPEKRAPPGRVLPKLRGKSAVPRAVANATAPSAICRDGHARELPRTGLPACPRSRRMAAAIPPGARSVVPGRGSEVFSLRQRNLGQSDQGRPARQLHRSGFQIGIHRRRKSPAAEANVPAQPDRPDCAAGNSTTCAPSDRLPVRPRPWAVTRVPAAAGPPG